jgi:hypothetical protein
LGAQGRGFFFVSSLVANNPELSENALLDVLLILSMFSEFIEDWNSAS